MHPASELTVVVPGVCRWKAFSPEHHVELCSHAVAASGRLFVFDPIPLEEPAFSDLAEAAAPAVVILTNDNHLRDAAAWSARLRATVWAAPGAALDLPNLHRLPVDDTVWEGWELYPLPGGPGGEIALYRPESALAIVGDALVNLPGATLEVLPAKYCQDPSQLRRSLRALAPLPFETLLMAHGDPLQPHAAARVAALLAAPE